MRAEKRQRYAFARPAAHTIVGDRPEYLAQFLIAEYAHVADSMLRNEEGGETRATFFITVVGIVVTVLVTGLETNAVAKALNDNVRFVLALLLMFGGVILLRIVRRNIVTDEYLRALGRLRRCFLSPDAAGVLAYDPYVAERPRFRRRLLGTGWAHVVALVNAGLVYALAASMVAGSERWSATAAAITTFVFVVQIAYARWRRWKAQVAAFNDSVKVKVASTTPAREG